MRRYEVILERVMVPYHQHDLARVIATQVLDARLGGASGVVDAFHAAQAVTGGDPRWPIPETASRAEVALVHNGPMLTTFRVRTTMAVPAWRYCPTSICRTPSTPSNGARTRFLAISASSRAIFAARASYWLCA